VSGGRKYIKNKKNIEMFVLVAAVAGGGKLLVPARSQRRRCVLIAESWPGIGFSPACPGLF